MYYYNNILLLATLHMLSSSLIVFNAEACSSRTVPKPRTTSSAATSSSMSGTALPGGGAAATTAAPPAIKPTTTSTTTTTTTARPNITFPTYKCPDTFDAWYCLNDATCFAVKIGELPVYSCECAIGFMGQRCEYKEIDGSYMPKRPRPMLEKASIASCAAFALLVMLFVCLTLYLRYDQKAAAHAALELYDELQHEALSSSSSSKKCCCSCCCNDKYCYSVAGGGYVDKKVKRKRCINNTATTTTTKTSSSINYNNSKWTYRQRLEHVVLSYLFKRDCI